MKSKTIKQARREKARADKARHGPPIDRFAMDEALSKRNQKGKIASTVLNTFLRGTAKVMYHVLLGRETPAQAKPGECRSCTQGATAVYRFEEWSDVRTFWERVPLIDLGMVVCLGHDGKPCPSPFAGERTVLAIDWYGFQQLNVRFCACPVNAIEGASAEEVLDTRDACQLVMSGYWPASYARPKTVFSLDVMNHFQYLANAANINVYDFINVLARHTDDVEPQNVEDRRREFLRAMRDYVNVTVCKCKGEIPRENMPPVCLAVLCPACPQPDINMVPGWEDDPIELSYRDAFIFAIDGNFHQNMKEKNVDPTDFPLWKGAAYFANEDQFKLYQDTYPSTGKQPTKCSRFTAMGYHGYLGKVSGMIGLSCARQMFVLPSGGVDLEKGERYEAIYLSDAFVHPVCRFVFVDFGLLSALQRYKSLKRLVGSYDIFCQYIIHLFTRLQLLVAWFEKFWNGVITMLPESMAWVFAVPKFHLIGHILKCRYKFSFNWLPGVGMTDGEGPERIWSSLNALGQRTREMSPGHRHDVINDYQGDWNWRRTQSCAVSTRRKWNDAQENLPAAERILRELEENIQKRFPGSLEFWKADEAEWQRKVVDPKEHAKLDNPYELSSSKALSVEDSLDPLPKPIVMDENEGSIAKEVEGTVGDQSEESVGDQSEESVGEGTTPPAGDEAKSPANAEEGSCSPLYALINEGLSLEKHRQDCLRAIESNDNASIVEKWYESLKTSYDAWRTRYNGFFVPLLDEAMGDVVVDSEAAPVVASASELEQASSVPAEPSDTATQPSGQPSSTSSTTKKRGREDESEKAPKQVKPSERLDGMEILLPSSYSISLQQKPSLAEAAHIERELQEVIAEKALNNLRTHIITKYAFLNDAKKIPTTQQTVTRKAAKTLQKEQAIHIAASDYRRTRAALVKLGMSEQDAKFHTLLAKDLVPFKISKQRGLGTSRDHDQSWIWGQLRFSGDVSSKKVDEYCEDVIRVHWFHKSAIYAHWKEEEVITSREMECQVLFHIYHKKKWEKDAEVHEASSRLGSAAYCRKQANVYQRLLDGCYAAFKGTGVKLVGTHHVPICRSSHPQKATV
ncbi:hypothetical protein NLI96_g4969 [Meripilus lineatus]|uniref:CxC2-like cysteine cluster KDZ transposase-associated domain-containing protein n=1 Tax=Meripilus lineatus TaxID=2056292 RepID=A0AAD5YJF2_9APHY|nr:hypothetical protein NLI96_g4969 [Physisporinus lineatus]